MKLLDGEKFSFILNDDGTFIKYAFSNKGRVFDLDKFKLYKCYKSKPIVHINGKEYKQKPRRFITFKWNGKRYTCQLARAIMIAFNKIENFENMEVDHIDGNPLNDELYNLEWVTHEENIRRVKEHELMPHGENHHNSKYSDELIHSICKDICNNLSRKEIKNKYNINGQLIDDIRSGRSHVFISREYVKDGFKYKKKSKEEKLNRHKKIHKICELIDCGKSNKEIIEELGLPENEKCLPNDIRKYRIYKYISKEYEFIKNKREM